MHRLNLTVALALLVTSCGGSSPAPTPQPANLVAQGTLVLQGCPLFSANNLFACNSFSGVM